MEKISIDCSKGKWTVYQKHHSERVRHRQRVLLYIFEKGFVSRIEN